MNEILTVAAILVLLVLQGVQLAYILKLAMDVEKFGRLLRKLRSRHKHATPLSRSPALPSSRSFGGTD